MSKALEQQEIEKEKIERVIFFLRDLYLLTKDGYTTVKWTVLSDKYLTSPLVKQVLLARGTITKAATKNLFYWSSKNIPNWDMAESIYQSTQALIQKEKANKQIVDSFKKKTEGKLIPVVKMPQTISEVFGLSKGENPVKAKLNKFSDERRVKAIQDLLDYCNIPRRSVDVQDMCKKVTLGVPTLQWLKITGWLKKNDLKHWQTTDLNSRFTLGHLESLKKDIKNNKNLAMEKDLNPNNFETETLAFIKGIDPEKWYSMSSLFVYMSRAKVPVHVREIIVGQRFENNKGKFRLNESKAILPANTPVDKLVDLQKKLNEKVLSIRCEYMVEGWGQIIQSQTGEHTFKEITNWLINNFYLISAEDKFLKVNQDSIPFSEVERMNRDIKQKDISTTSLNYPKFSTIAVKEKHEEIAKGNKSIVENLKQQRIEFAKMLFKLGDVKAANEILTKELE